MELKIKPDEKDPTFFTKSMNLPSPLSIKERVHRPSRIKENDEWTDEWIKFPRIDRRLSFLKTGGHR